MAERDSVLPQISIRDPWSLADDGLSVLDIGTRATARTSLEAEKNPTKLNSVDTEIRASRNFYDLMAYFSPKNYWKVTHEKCTVMVYYDYAYNKV